jgi:hypothetical protein
MALYDRAKAEWGYGIRPEDESNFPKPIQPGERWEGWFESKRALPDETEAIIVGIGAFRLEVPDRTMFSSPMMETVPLLVLQATSYP